MSATEGLIALLEQPGAGDPDVREVTRALRRAPQVLTEEFDHYQSLIDAVGPEQAARIVVNSAPAAHKRWLVR